MIFKYPLSWIPSHLKTVFCACVIWCNLFLSCRLTSFSLLSFNLLLNSWFSSSLQIGKSSCSQRLSLLLWNNSKRSTSQNRTSLIWWTSLHWKVLHSSMHLLKNDRRFTASTLSSLRFISHTIGFEHFLCWNNYTIELN